MSFVCVCYHPVWGVTNPSIKLTCLSEHVMCVYVLCSLQHNTHNITPLLVHPLLPLKQQDCQCCNHYCHLLHLALLVSFEERSLYTFDAHPRGSVRSTDKIVADISAQRRRGVGPLASEKMSNVVCRAAGSSLRCFI